MRNITLLSLTSTLLLVSIVSAYASILDDNIFTNNPIAQNQRERDLHYLKLDVNYLLYEQLFGDNNYNQRQSNALGFAQNAYGFRNLVGAVEDVQNIVLQQKILRSTEPAANAIAQQYGLSKALATLLVANGNLSLSDIVRAKKAQASVLNNPAKVSNIFLLPQPSNPNIQQQTRNTNQIPADNKKEFIDAHLKIVNDPSIKVPINEQYDFVTKLIYWCCDSHKYSCKQIENNNESLKLNSNLNNLCQEVALFPSWETYKKTNIVPSAKQFDLESEALSEALEAYKKWVDSYVNALSICKHSTCNEYETCKQDCKACSKFDDEACQRLLQVYINAGEKVLNSNK